MTTPPSTRDLGTVELEGTTPVLRWNRHLPHPPEKVWRGLTESEHLRHWLPCDIVGDRAEGATVSLPFWPDHVETYELDPAPLTGTILTWRPHEVFEWTWDTDRLRFELEARDDGTLLRFTTWIGDPTGHGVDGSPDDASGTTSAAAGYHVCLDHLAALLADHGPVSRLVDSDPAGLEARYRAVVVDALR